MNKVLGIWLIIVIFPSFAHGAEALWCRGPMEIRLMGHGIIEVLYLPPTGPAGRNGGKLNPGNCAYENSPGPTGGNLQIVFQSSDWKPYPEYIQALYRSYVDFLSKDDYVVLMGFKGEDRFNYKLFRAMPFRKDLTRPKRQKMGAELK